MNPNNNLNNSNEDKSDESKSSDKHKSESGSSESQNEANENTPSNSLDINSLNLTPKPASSSLNNSHSTQPASNSSRLNYRNQNNHQSQYPGQTQQNYRSSLNSQSKHEQALEDEATRLFLDMASDPDLMNQALNAAVNPNVAKELARQADTAWRNIETVPGGYQALCKMHHNIQQPLWNAVIGRDVPTPSSSSLDIKTPVHNEPIKVNAMPNPWRPDPQPQQHQNFNSFPSFSFGDQNPFSFLTQNTSLSPDRSSSASVSSDMLSSVISRNRPSSFQTASQLIHTTHNTGSDRYSKEIDELVQMGITDRDKCLIALEAANGDIFQALGILEELEKEENKDS